MSFSTVFYITLLDETAYCNVYFDVVIHWNSVLSM